MRRAGILILFCVGLFLCLSGCSASPTPQIVPIPLAEQMRRLEEENKQLKKEVAQLAGIQETGGEADAPIEGDTHITTEENLPTEAGGIVQAANMDLADKTLSWAPNAQVIAPGQLIEVDGVCAFRVQSAQFIADIGDASHLDITAIVTNTQSQAAATGGMISVTIVHDGLDEHTTMSLAEEYMGIRNPSANGTLPGEEVRLHFITRLPKPYVADEKSLDAKFSVGDKEYAITLR